MSDALCPSAESLRAFAVGELPETEIDELVVHLASCPVCEAGLTQLDHLSDPLILNLRLRVPASIGETMVAEPPTLTGLSARLDADAPIPEHLGGLRLIREIGRGGMGIVYEAFEGSLNRHVAIKLLPGRGDIARFRREAPPAGFIILISCRYLELANTRGITIT
jgi:hypothetical protein